MIIIVHGCSHIQRHQLQGRDIPRQTSVFIICHIICFWEYISHMSMCKSTVRIWEEKMRVKEVFIKVLTLFVLTSFWKKTKTKTPLFPSFIRQCRFTSYVPESLVEPWSLITVERPGIGCVVRYQTACKTSVAWILLWSVTSEQEQSSVYELWGPRTKSAIYWTNSLVLTFYYFHESWPNFLGQILFDYSSITP